MRFRIYYGDETTFTCPDDGEVEDAPTRNVQCIIWDFTPPAGRGDIGRHCLESWDYYVWSDAVGAWHGTNKTLDLVEHLLDEGCGLGGVRAVLIGKWIDRERWLRIKSRARDEGNDFRRRTGRIPAEDGSEE